MDTERLDSLILSGCTLVLILFCLLLLWLRTKGVPWLPECIVTIGI
ncbi:hypothetical protein KIPB_013645, partial [Kipferlia bialata]|eukprot:g13645.t1